MIQEIKNNFDKNYKLNSNIMSNKNKLNYLYNILNISIINKDIELFLLFLYLHDTLKLYFETKEYNDWKLITTYNLAYEVNKFSILDLKHYNDNIETSRQQKIFIYLSKNLEENGFYLLKKNSWVKLNIKSLLKTYIRVLGKFCILYNKILHNRYKPGGNGYYTSLENWKKIS
jgi:hypothetical protein